MSSLDQKKVSQVSEKEKEVEEEEEDEKNIKDMKSTKPLTRKITQQEKDYIIKLYLNNYRLEDEELPGKGLKEFKAKDVLQLIVSKLKTKHNILSLFNTNKLLVMAKYVLQKNYTFKKQKKQLTRADIMIKIEKLQSQLDKLQTVAELDEGYPDDDEEDN